NDAGDECGVAGAASECANLVERRGEGHQTITRDSTVGGLDSHTTAECRRLSDGPPGVRPQRRWAFKRRDSARGTARRSARNSLGVPWVPSRKEGGILGRAAHGELVHVESAENNGTRGAEFLDDCRVVRGDEFVQAVA